jgi:gas vesicle protein
MSKDFNSFLKGLAIGAVAGAAAGLLLAPKSGAETREDLKELALKAKEKTQDLYIQARKSVERKVRAVKKLGEKIDEKKYSQFVEEIVDEYKNKELLSSDAAKKLGRQLRSDWKDVKKAITA